MSYAWIFLPVYFSVIALRDAVNQYQGSCIGTALSRAGHLCYLEGVLEVVARIESVNVKPPRLSGSGLHESTSITSRKHLSGRCRKKHNESPM